MTRDPRTGLAVLLIDMQPVFIRQLRPGAAAHIIPHQLRTIRICAERDIPLVVVEYAQIPAEPTHETLRVAAVSVLRQERIVKQWDNAFADTRLQEHLDRWGVETLFLMGINATACVRWTAHGALQRKFGVVTSPNVIAGKETHPADDDIGWFASKGRIVDTFDELLAPPRSLTMRIARRVSWARTVLAEEAR